MDKLGVAEVVGVAGIVLAALLSSFGYLYRNALERKKSAKRLLFVLLEVRYILITSIFDPDDATEKYLLHSMKRMGSHNPFDSTKDFPQDYRDLIASHFRGIIDVVDGDIEEVVPQYEEALSSMAEVNPVLAYSLRGRMNFKTLVESTNDYEKQFATLLKDGNPKVKEVDEVLKFSCRAKEKAFAELASLIDEDVIRVAKFCGLRDWLRCRRVLKKGVSNENKYDFSELDEAFDEYMKSVPLTAFSDK